jgi:hypothetical protein
MPINIGDDIWLDVLNCTDMATRLDLMGSSKYVNRLVKRLGFEEEWEKWLTKIMHALWVEHRICHREFSHAYKETFKIQDIIRQAERGHVFPSSLFYGRDITPSDDDLIKAKLWYRIRNGHVHLNSIRTLDNHLGKKYLELPKRIRESKNSLEPERRGMAKILGKLEKQTDILLRIWQEKLEIRQVILQGYATKSAISLSLRKLY